MRAGHLAWFLTLLLSLVTHTLPQRKIPSVVNVKKAPPQQRVVKKTFSFYRKLPHLGRELAYRQLKKEWTTYQKIPGTVHIDNSIPRVEFERSGYITLKDVFQFMHYCPVLYPNERRPTFSQIPIGGKLKTFGLQNKADQTFSLTQVAADDTETNIDDSTLNTAVTHLSNPTLDPRLKDTLRKGLVQAAESKLKEQPDFEKELKSRDPNGEISPGDRDKAFGAGNTIMTASFVQLKDFKDLRPANWLQHVLAHFENLKFKTELETYLSTNIKDNGKTKLKYEVTASFLVSKTSAIHEWNQLKTDGIITETEVGSGKNKHLKVTLAASNKITLRTLFKLLQFYPDIYEDQKFKKTRFEVPIGGEPVKFCLSTSNPRRGGRHQIFAQTF